jgi:hypothetical protein
MMCAIRAGLELKLQKKDNNPALTGKSEFWIVASRHDIL